MTATVYTYGCDQGQFCDPDYSFERVGGDEAPVVGCGCPTCGRPAQVIASRPADPMPEIDEADLLPQPDDALFAADDMYLMRDGATGLMPWQVYEDVEWGRYNGRAIRS